MHSTIQQRTRLCDLPLFSGKAFTLFVFFFTLVMEALIAELNFPATIHYVNDLFVLCLLLVMLVKPGRVIRKAGTPVFVAAVIVFLVFTTSAILGEVRLELYVWALRNTFRGLVFFFACVTYLHREDLPSIFDKLFVLQLVSLALAIYQHFVLGLNMDDTGGIFGHGNGAGVNPFNALIFAYYLNMYLADRESIGKLAVAALSSLIIAAVAEEKFTFIAFVVIAVFSLLLSRATSKVVMAALIVGVAGFVGMSILESMYPAMFEVLTTEGGIDKYLSSTVSGGYELPRVGSFAIISNMFFRDDPLRLLFGVGFGNGETSTFTFLVGPYYEIYGYLHYRWFTHQWTFLECGYVGFVTYLAFFVVVALRHLAMRYRVGREDVPYLVCAFVLSLCVILSIWYNATLKVDMSYISYFSLAIGFIAMSRSNKEAG